MKRLTLLAALAAAGVHAGAREFGDIPPSTSDYLRNKREAKALFEAAKGRILAQLAADAKDLAAEVGAASGSAALIEAHRKAVAFAQPLFTNTGFRQARSQAELDALAGEGDSWGPGPWARLMLRDWNAKEDAAVVAARKAVLAARDARWGEIEAALNAQAP